jgi:hypothetical protein
MKKILLLAAVILSLGAKSEGNVIINATYPDGSFPSLYFCHGEEILLTASDNGGIAGDGYWTIGDRDTLFSAGDVRTTAEWVYPGGPMIIKYFVFGGDSGTLELYANYPASVNFDDKTLCPGDSVELKINVEGGSKVKTGTGSWYGPNGFKENNDSMIVITEIGSYGFDGRDENNCFIHYSKPINQGTNCSPENNIVFLDANFKNALITQQVVNIAGTNDTTLIIDTNKDGEISYQEALDAKYIISANAGINNIAGIEYFKNLVELELVDSIPNVDLTQNKELDNIRLYNCSIDSLNVVGLEKITWIAVLNNSFTELDLSSIPGPNMGFQVDSDVHVCLSELMYNNLPWPGITTNRSFNCGLNPINIPDSLFKNLLVSDFTINTNGDQEIDFDELENIVSVDASNLGITDFTGIELMLGLLEFNASGNPVSTICIDASQNTSQWIKEDTCRFSTSCGDNSVYIHDGMFREHLGYHSITINDSGEVSWTDAAVLNQFSATWGAIATFRGIEVFTNLTSFTIGLSGFSKDSILDLSGNSKINHVNITGIKWTAWEYDTLQMCISSLADTSGWILPPHKISIKCGFNPIEMDNSELLTALYNHSPSLDLNSDGYITYNELDNVSTLNLSNQGLTDVSGIEIFSNLVTLNLSNNSLTKLDVSGLDSLSSLTVDNNSELAVVCVNQKQLDNKTSTWAKDETTQWGAGNCDLLTSVHDQGYINGQLYFYPNPAKDIIFISENIVGVYNTLGTQVMGETPASAQVELNLSPGMYFIQFENGVIEKLVVK